jgi:hypothetical protein
MRLWLIGITAFILTTGTLTAQPAPEVSSGQDGQLLPGPFRVFAVTGERAQHFHCFFCQHGLAPSIAVIALQGPANPQDPLAVLLQKLNGFAAAHKDARFGAFGVFLTLAGDFYADDARLAKVAELEGLNTQLNLADVSLGLSYPDAQPVKQFGIITRDDPVNMIKRHQVTVLVYNRHRVIRRFTFTEDKKIDEEALKEIFAAAESALKP